MHQPTAYRVSSLQLIIATSFLDVMTDSYACGMFRVLIIGRLLFCIVFIIVLSPDVAKIAAF